MTWRAISARPYLGGGDAAALLSAFPVLALLAMPEAAEAAVNPVASAAVAYGHYFGLLVFVAMLVTEKWTVKGEELTEAEANRLVVADSVYGVAGGATVSEVCVPDG